MTNIREVRLEDAADMLHIYAPYITDSAVSFETEVPSVETFKARIEDYRKLGWYVFEQDGRVIGYAYASRYRERKAYQWCCEVSAYVDSKFHRGGVARKLYERLFQDLTAKGFLNAYAVITLPNAASTKFHEAVGFRHFATYEEVGYKLGLWHDVGWWRLKLNEAHPAPKPPV